MKKIIFLLVLLSSQLFCPAVSKIVDTEDDTIHYNADKVMKDIATEFSHLANAQKQLSSGRHDKKSTLKIIEDYQKSMDYQQVNLDKLRKALQ